MSKRKRVSECCGAPVIGGASPHNPKQKYYTCSACHFWPVELIIVEEDKDERKRDTSNKSQTP